MGLKCVPVGAIREDVLLCVEELSLYSFSK